jgi:diaminopimelate epimerase
LKFSKFHALGNDFLIVDRDEVADFTDYADLARAMCERHTGAGADGLILISVQSAPKGEVSFRIFNADGSEAEISGNGLRCAAAYLFAQGRIDGDTAVFLTGTGSRSCRLIERRGSLFTIRIEMGVPRLAAAEIPFDDGRPHGRIIDYPLMINRKVYPVTAVSMGNPHCDVFVDQMPARIEWQEIGREIEIHPFFPHRTNVEFVKLVGRGEIEVVFWERGVGETLSSGSGSCAAAVAAILKGYVDRRVKVKTVLGALLVEWDAESEPVYQTGPAEFSFVGSFLLK